MSKKTEKTKNKPSKTLAIKVDAPAKNTKALAVRPPSAEISELLLEDEGVGQDNITRDDLAIPRIKILQDLSPEVKKTESAYIEGAEAGQICDNVGGQLFDGEEGIVIVPISYRRAYLEWRDRKKKESGFVCDHGTDGDILNSCTKDDEGRNVLEGSGNIIVVTGEYFVFLVNPETGEYAPYVLSMAGTQLKKSRRLNTMINQFKAPRPDGKPGTFTPAMFYRSYKLETVPERNDRGSWFGWKITPYKNTLDLPGGEEIYLAAREFRRAVAEGKVTASQPHADEVGGSAREDDDAPM